MVDGAVRFLINNLVSDGQCRTIVLNCCCPAKNRLTPFHLFVQEHAPKQDETNAWHSKPKRIDGASYDSIAISMEFESLE